MKRGFTLVEIITVLAIIGIGMGLFYSTLFINWSLFERQLTLIDLQMEADKIMEMLSSDGRSARKLDVSADGRQVTFSFPTGNPVAYSLTAQGEIQRSVGGVSNPISQNIDFNNSSFEKLGNSLGVNLMLDDDVFGRRVELGVSTQILPRNLL